MKTNDPEAKIRVVFDASMNTSRGTLNDLLHTGPKLQADIVDVLVQFRRFPVVFTADMVKMYRQILVHPDDRVWQHVLWRDSPELPVETYELNTVTYGLSCAPYLALRVVKQLVEDEGDNYPLAAAALTHGLYVDDILYGASSKAEALDCKAQLSSIAEKGGFTLHKWCSNEKELSDTQADAGSLEIVDKTQPCIKVLGIHWNTEEDIFTYKIHLAPMSITKREILSAIARLFDPLGLLGPVIMCAKIILQRLWSLKVDWDEAPPTSVCHDWERFYKDLPTLEKVRIPRHVTVGDEIKLYGFCDASELGYGAVAYLSVLPYEGADPRIFLLKSKSKLAPLKQISIPRLELCAAWLLAKLIRSLKSAIETFHVQQVLLYSDSTIVLSWLKLSPNQLKTFIANRVSYILQHTNPDSWCHVAGRDNPADILSRGCHPAALLEDPLWWSGPGWLMSVNSSCPHLPELLSSPPEMKPLKIHTLLHMTDDQLTILDDIFPTNLPYPCSIRRLTYIQRFIFNLRHSTDRRTGPISAEEFLEAERLAFRLAQEREFSADYNFEENRPISTRFKQLCVFADASGVLRVGGRLARATYSEEIKHPVVLTKQMSLVENLVAHVHVLYYHLNVTAMLAFFRPRYWIFGLKSLLKSKILTCPTCYRFVARPWHPLMGELPPSRSHQGRPFLHVGLDFAGPFMYKISNRRNSPHLKCYLCVYVCMSTKAVHLELVTALTTEAFLRSFDRFTARRGTPSEVFSDNGTNFQGAARALNELHAWLKNEQVEEAITVYTAQRGIKWHFSPPLSPHFGGLWEAAVRSMKYFTKRVLGDQAFTFEEGTTFFCRVEAILNSRPLCPLTNDEENFEVLTPGHFLIGASLTAPPEVSPRLHGLPSLRRWQMIQAAQSHFWRSWQRDYLHLLQQRPKWLQRKAPIRCGDLVLLRDPTASPLHWPVGRVIEVHPGEDGIVRVVTLRTPQGVYKRSVTSLSPFPPQDQPEPN